MVQRPIPRRKRALIYVFLLFSMLHLTISSAMLDKMWCDNVVLKSNPTKTKPFFPHVYTTLAEETVSEGNPLEATTYSQFSVQFAGYTDQVSVEMDSVEAHLTAYVDANTNVCLIQQSRNGQCVKSEDPCVTISELTGTVRQDGDRVSLKSPSQSLGWDPDRFDKIVKVGPGQTRGLSSILYVTCAKVKDSADTVISQWHFLDVDIFESTENKPVLIKVAHTTQNDSLHISKVSQIDYVDFKDMQGDTVQPNLDFVNDQCISGNKKKVYKTIPTPPARFSFIKETIESQPGSNDRATDSEILQYNKDAQWFHSEAYFNLMDKTKRVELEVTEDFATGVRYETSQGKKSCKISPYLTRAAKEDTDDAVEMKTPNEFWNMDPDTAVYLGVSQARGIHCDVWRVGLPGADKETSHKLFLATSNWLRKRRLPVDSFLPLEAIEQNGPSLKHHSYFNFTSNIDHFKPDVSACFNSNDSVTIRLTLLTFFSRNIQPNWHQFELKFNRAVLRLSQMVSALRVADIKAKRSPDFPCQTRVTFKILGRPKVSTFPIQDQVSKADAVARLKEAVQAGKFQLTLVVNSTNLLVKAKPSSFALRKEVSSELRELDDEEETSSAGLTTGIVGGFSVLALVIGAMAGIGAAYTYGRRLNRQRRKKEADARDGDRPDSSAHVYRSVFSMLAMKTEEANWSWT